MTHAEAVRMKLSHASLIILVSGIGLPIVSRASAAEPPEQVEFFEKKIRPVLAERCYSCHSAQAKTLQGGLRLDSKPGWKRGGDTGAVIAPGDPEKSRLVDSLRWTDPDVQIPPDDHLPQPQVDPWVEWLHRSEPDLAGAH